MFIILLAQQETKEKEDSENNNPHQSRCSKLRPRGLMQA